MDMDKYVWHSVRDELPPSDAPMLILMVKHMLCNKLEKFDRHDWKAILDQSIYAGWQDIYALKQDDQYEQSTEMEFPRL